MDWAPAATAFTLKQIIGSQGVTVQGVASFAGEERGVFAVQGVRVRRFSLVVWLMLALCMMVPRAGHAANLVANPGFEASTAGWGAYLSAVSRVQLAGTPEGAYAGRVAVNAFFVSTFAIDDTGYPVPATTAGSRYVASAYVRAAVSSSVGRPAYIVIRETTTSGTVVKTTTSLATTLGNTWTKIAVSAQAVASGNRLDMYVYQGGVNALDNAFFIDRVSFDTAAPTATITQQAGGTFTGTQVALSGAALGMAGATTASVTVASIDRVGGAVDGVVSAAACADIARTTQAWACTWPAARFASGPYRLTVSVTDASGAVASESIDINFANTSPQHQNANAYQDWTTAGNSFTRLVQDVTFAKKAQATYASILFPQLVQRDSATGATTTYNYGGYMGLQTNGGRVDGSIGDTVIFSWWDKSATTADRSVATSGTCKRFGGEGDGVSCRLAYPIVQGRTYRFRVERVLDKEWAAFVTDTVTGIESKIGQIRIMDAGELVRTSNFLEYFGPAQPTCNDVPSSMALFSSPLVTTAAGVLSGAVSGAPVGACAGSAAGATTVGVGRQLRLGS